MLRVKERPVGTAEVEQHAVVAGHRDDLEAGDHGRFAGVMRVFGSHGRVLIRIRVRAGRIKLTDII